VPADGGTSPAGAAGPLPQDLLLGGGAGVLSGSLGIGGGVLLVPSLVLLRGVPQKVAQATSLVMVSVTALAATTVYLLGGRVAWSAVPFLVAGGLVGVQAGTALVVRVRSRWLQIAFSALLILVAARLAVPTAAGAAPASGLPELTPAPIAAYVVSGAAMGLLSALFGIGGGIILVPILVLLMGYGQLVAAGTSLSVMVVIALYGAVRLSRSGLTQWRAGLRFGAGGVIGSVVGASVAALLPERALAVVFAVLLLVVGVRLALHAARTPTLPLGE